MPIRYLLIVATFLISVLLYVDRACISIAKEDIARDLGFTDKEMGWVMGAFAIGYALMQTPSGALADRFGPRGVMTAIVFLWSIFTALTGVVRQLWTMVIVRTVFGACEAGAFPSCARAFFSWLPVGERGLAQGINFSGTRIGAALAMPVLAWLVAELGWQEMFWILGGIGCAVAVGWFLFFRDTPESHPWVSAHERDDILRRRQKVSPQSSEKVPLVPMARSANMWMLMGQYFASNITFFFTISWFPSYLQGQFDLELKDIGWLAALPLLGGAVGNWVSGALVDAIYRRQRWTMSRRVPAVAGFGLAAVGMAMCGASDTAAGAVTWLAVAIFGADMTLSPSWSFCIDIGGRHAGAVSGTMNMAGNVGSFATGLMTPYLAAWTGTSTTFFALATGLNVVAVILWLLLRPDRPLEAELDEPIPEPSS